MMKRAYGAPVIREEVFAADEYVAACWNIACGIGENAGYGDAGAAPDLFGGSDTTHGKIPEGRTGCGYKENQYIVVGADGNVSMTEQNARQFHDMPCTITDDDWNPISLNASQLKPGMVIHWTTSGTGGDTRVWHHMGYVQMKDSDRPNHS